MSSSQTIYRDITDDPEAKSRLVDAPELRQALLACGFRCVGIVEGRAPQALDPAQVQAMFSVPDAEMLLEATQKGDVTEVMASADQRAFGYVDRFFGWPVVCFRTLLENGVVVETVSRPRRRPQPAEGGALLTKAMRLSMGPFPLWARDNWPQAGYYCELVDTRDPQALWQRHQKRVQHFAQTHRSQPTRHDSLELSVAISERGNRIIQYRNNWQSGCGLAAVVLTMLTVFLGMVELMSAMMKMRLSGASPNPLWIIAALLGFVLIACLAMLLMALFNKAILPLIPGPALQPATELLKEKRLSP